MRRYLPPLVILILVGLVAARVLLHPAREDAQNRIRALQTDPTQADETAAAIETYLETYTDADDRWFAAESYLRMGRPQRAIDTVFGEGALADQPGTARRFGDLGLRVAGWRDARREEATAFEPGALVALAEAGEPWAADLLLERARTLPLEASASYLFHATTFSDPEILALLARGFRQNPESDPDRKLGLQIAAAFSVLGPEPYTEREADIERLIDVLRSRRRTQGDVWTASAVALGRSEDPRALEALTRHETFLGKATSTRDRRDLAIIRIALLMSGDWSQAGRLRPLIDAEPADAFLIDWYTAAVLGRYLRGDPEAGRALRETFEELGARVARIRSRIGVKLLLPPGPISPDEPAARAPVERMLETFWHSRESPLMPGIAASYGLRAGLPEARERLLELMGVISAALEEGPQRHERVMPGWLLCLRALRLYG